MTYVVTGHRPDKLGGYSEKNLDKLERFALKTLESLSPSPTELVVGMALGWDQAMALAAWVKGIPFLAAVPFEGQEKVWDIRQQAHPVLSGTVQPEDYRLHRPDSGEDAN